MGNYDGNVGRYFMDHPLIESAFLFPNKDKDFSLYSPNTLNKRMVAGFFKLTQQALRKYKLNNLRMVRNHIVHSSKYVTQEDAKMAVEIVAEVIRGKGK